MCHIAPLQGICFDLTMKPAAFAPVCSIHTKVIPSTAELPSGAVCVRHSEANTTSTMFHPMLDRLSR